MIHFRTSLILATILCVAPLLALPTCARAEDEQPLIELLQSNAPKAEKAITCKKLAVWGSAKAVPALAALLPDPQLTSWARIALEAIPDDAAGQALRDALGKVDGLTLVGVINSLAVRHDGAAVDPLIGLLSNDNTEVGAAAAAALGRIGGPKATAALRKSLAKAPAPVRSAMAEGLVMCAERMLDAGKTADAVQLYEELRGADLPKQRTVEATRGVILARGAEGVPLLVELLQSNDKIMTNLGLTVARELRGDGVSMKLIAALDKLPARMQPLLILAMADRGDAEAVPALLAATQKGPASIRIAALKVLARLGDASCLPELLKAATATDTDVAASAKTTIKQLPDKAVDAALVNRLADARGDTRLALIQLIGMRRIDAVAPLLKAADDPDGNVRTAALLALGEVAQLENVPLLIGRVVSPAHAEDAASALKALQAACVRMPDREACAAKLSDALAKAPPKAKLAILETLTQMGGKTALEALAKAARADDADLQDAATRLLGSWMTVDAGPVLLKLAQTDNYQYRIRSLRGYIRLVRQFLMTDRQRAAMCRSALETADRDAEQTLVAEVINRYPSVDMLQMLVSTAKQPRYRDEANALARSVAAKIGGANADTLIALVDRAPAKIEIVNAKYGAGKKFKDVTAILRRQIHGLPLIVLSPRSYNSAFGGDPVPSVTKKLRVQYRINGKEGTAEFAENALIILQDPK